MSVLTKPSTPTRIAPANVFHELLAFLQRLKDAKIAHTIRHSRPDAVMVEIVVPGERWEVDFLEDGDIDVEVFRSADGVFAADDHLDRLIETFGDR